MRFSDEINPIDRDILGFKTRISVKRIESAAIEGTVLLTNIRMLEETYGLPHTFSFAQEYLDYEQYFLFVRETATSMGLSITACLIVILIITASIQATLLVAFCVLLVDMFLSALIFYWGLTFNPLVVINIVIAIGLSVDYSAHISHSYLVTQAPQTKAYESKEKIRVYKAQQALSKMGSSVFHGGFSTFLAIVTLAPSKTYIFLVFFRLWFGIIIFGMANGFMLLPVILSFIGQTEAVVDHEHIDNADDSDQEEEIDKNAKRYESETNPLFHKNETEFPKPDGPWESKEPGMEVEMAQMNQYENKQSQGANLNQVVPPKRSDSPNLL